MNRRDKSAVTASFGSGEAMRQARMATPSSVEMEVPTCPLCGDNAVESVYTNTRDRLFCLPGEYGVVACRTCSLVRTSPRPVRRSIGLYYPDEYIAYTSPSSNAEAGWVYRGARALARLPHRLAQGPELPEFTPPAPGAAALDVGCGAGAELRRLAERGWKVYGIEPHAEAALRLRSDLGLGADRILAMPAEEATFPSQTFHLARLNHVLEHLHDPVQVLRSIYKWMASGGELRISVPNFASRERRLFGERWFGLDVPRHLFHFSPQTLAFTLEETGFTITELRSDLMPASLEGSIRHFLAERHGGAPYTHSRRLYLATVPVASLLSPFGWSSVITAVARKS